MGIVNSNFDSLLPTTDTNGFLGYVTIDPNGNVTTHSESADLTFTAGNSNPPGVPEPASAFLLIGGGVGLFAFARLHARAAKR